MENALSLKHWGEPPKDGLGTVGKCVAVHCGWGRVLFGQTFDKAEHLAAHLMEEETGERDLAIYVRDPHVVLSLAPQALFMDPSHSYRLNLKEMPVAARNADSTMFDIRPATAGDEGVVNRIYTSRGMVSLRSGYLAELNDRRCVAVLVAESAQDGEVLGVVMGIDHAIAFDDPEEGSSLWALAVDSQAAVPAVGIGLVTALAERFREAGRAFMDLSVLHDNAEAIGLYEKMGFERVPVYTVKKKNPINESLFIGPQRAENLNIYAKIIIDEARRRGIHVDIEDAEAGLFSLTLGGRSIACRESLSELTSAVAMSRCDDKSLTHRTLAKADLKVPGQATLCNHDDVRGFLDRYGRIVIKPARGEQGQGVYVDLCTEDEALGAFDNVFHQTDHVIGEEFVSGRDLRIIVIGDEVAAAAVRRPPRITGDGQHTIQELIQRLSRRRAAATGGESRIPVDDETRRCVQAQGHGMNSVLSDGTVMEVRKTANLHCGGTIHDVTDDLHPVLRNAALAARQVLGIPVVGFDFMVPRVDGPDYRIIEANERPGLANHEPQPTAQKFVDFLFPETRQEMVKHPAAG
ncbi:MAG: N-acetylglutaminylglutamine synthetase [Rhodospirillales bacterium CG15_BIG_FIL_POST_REV_8_21_14_020_66_15]|nr:MAG: N-acetylglutaminylglutamine synthetase [Rhodospirillales bacterium CG15_BIG_FIL_POST_REV_8_21_14_020_66_15]